MPNFDPITTSSFFTEVYFFTRDAELDEEEGLRLSEATSFGYLKEESVYLVTNWHVVSGKNSVSGELLDQQHGSVPSHLKVHSYVQMTSGGLGGDLPFSPLLPAKFWLPLKNDEGIPIWLEHQRFGGRADIAVIPLGDILQYKPVLSGGHPEYGSIETPLNSIENLSSARLNAVNDIREADISLPVGESLFLVGYPFGRNSPSGPIPVWKQGTIASEPELWIDGIPMFFIDAATRPGMSGSPVVAKMFGSYQNTEGATVVAGSASRRFVGVYSGRVPSDKDSVSSSVTEDIEEWIFKAQLGRVFPRTSVDEIISEGVSGKERLP